MTLIGDLVNWGFGDLLAPLIATRVFKITKSPINQITN